MSKSKKLTEGGEGGEGGGGGGGGNGENFLNCNPTKLLKKLDIMIYLIVHTHLTLTTWLQGIQVLPLTLPAAAASFFVTCLLGN